MAGKVVQSEPEERGGRQALPGDIPWPASKVVHRDPRKLKAHPRNARRHAPDQIADLAALMLSKGVTAPILTDEHGVIIYGHARQLAAIANIEAGHSRFKRYPTFVAKGLSDEEKRSLMLADNAIALRASWDDDLLRIEIGELKIAGVDLTSTGFDEAAIEAILNPTASGDAAKAGAGSLAAKFGVPPFTVLNAREGWWQDRKRAWLALGIQSELGRGDNLVGRSLSDRLAIIVPGHFSAAKAFIDKWRAAGLSDEEIEAKAMKQFRRSNAAAEKSPAIAGTGADFSKVGNVIAVGQRKGMSAPQQMLAKRAAEKAARKAKGKTDGA